ncbi:unnamed protein product [Haemonchus placei]|uniref:Keratin, type I cytoskeletal 9-like n=1 Tax=Haemonchus placei TaxID=6290 RepID=A0A0N4XAN1_HAEPC|nr:unnamed protein product [Haemonchus placei]
MQIIQFIRVNGDRKPKGSILLKDVVPYICVGLMTDRMPGLGGAALGFGSGMLMGSLLSYGMGSMWGGHSMIPSYGGGFGMGGGYYSDNDTTITNNYYNYPDPNAAGTAVDANDSQPAIQDVTDQDDVVDSDPPRDDSVDVADANQDDVEDNDHPAQDDAVEDAGVDQDDVPDNDYAADDDVVDNGDMDQHDTNQDYTNADDYGYGGDTGYDYGGDDYGGGDFGGGDFGGGDFGGGDFGGGDFGGDF